MKHRTGSSWPLGDDLEFDLLELEFNVLDRPAKLKVVFASTAAKKPRHENFPPKKNCQIKKMTKILTVIITLAALSLSDAKIFNECATGKSLLEQGIVVWRLKAALVSSLIPRQA